MRRVPAESWVAAVTQARADGYDFFDWLGAEDLVGQRAALRVVLALRRLDRPGDVLLLATELDRDAPRLDSVRTLFAGAAWHEREAAELFGVQFAGGEPGRLLLASGFTGSPLRKDEVLAARTGTAWPGAKEPGESGEVPGGRRRLAPPGVPDPAVWGDRDDAGPAADPTQVAESAAGGRTRRRRP